MSGLTAVRTNQETYQRQASEALRDLQASQQHTTEPVKSAITRVLAIIDDPTHDATTCKVAGKTLHIVAMFKEDVQGDVYLFRDMGNQTFAPGLAANEQKSPDFKFREFTVQIPIKEMNDMFLFKLALVTKNGSEWQTNIKGNYKRDLSKCGRDLYLELKDVTFPKVEVSEESEVSEPEASDVGTSAEAGDAAETEDSAEAKGSAETEDSTEVGETGSAEGSAGTEDSTGVEDTDAAEDGSQTSDSGEGKAQVSAPKAEVRAAQVTAPVKKAKTAQATAPVPVTAPVATAPVKKAKTAQATAPVPVTAPVATAPVKKAKTAQATAPVPVTAPQAKGKQQAPVQKAVSTSKSTSTTSKGNTPKSSQQTKGKK